MSGEPCIVGTRVPIEVIVSLLKQGYPLKEINKMYPWVGMDKLQGALDELVDIVHNEAKKALSQTQASA